MRFRYASTISDLHLSSYFSSIVLVSDSSGRDEKRVYDGRLGGSIPRSTTRFDYRRATASGRETESAEMLIA